MKGWNTFCILKGEKSPTNIGPTKSLVNVIYKSYFSKIYKDVSNLLNGNISKNVPDLNETYRVWNFFSRQGVMMKVNTDVQNFSTLTVINEGMKIFN